VKDIPVWVRRNGHRLVAIAPAAEGWTTYRIEKRHDAGPWHLPRRATRLLVAAARHLWLAAGRLRARPVDPPA
jgi:hypothetical protein